MRLTSLSAPLFVAFPIFAQSPEEKQATIVFLKSLQQPDGGFVAAPADSKSDAAPKSSLRATSGAVRAIKYFGGEVPNADKALEFVKSCYSQETGAFADAPKRKEDITITAVGMMAAVELQKEPCLDQSIAYLVKNAKTFEERRLAVAGMEAAKKFDPAIKQWFVEIEGTRNWDGTFGKGDGQARETGGVAAMILRSGGKFSDDHRKAIVAALRAGQRSDGGFGKVDSKASDGETTYRVMRAFYLLGEKPKDVVKLKSFLASCRNKDGGYGVAPGQASTVGGTYYVAAIGKWLAK
jgi:prenyltransferase beta subunit